MAIITNFTGAALDQQLFAVDSRIAESTRRATELEAARAGANFGGLDPANFFVPLGSAFPGFPSPATGVPGGFPSPASGVPGLFPFPASGVPGGFPSPASGVPGLFPFPASGVPGGFPSPASGVPALFPSPAPFQDFSAQMLGSLGQLSGNWLGLLGAPAGMGFGFGAGAAGLGALGGGMGAAGLGGAGRQSGCA